jgi:peptidoglycan hydrolase-like protein with peptidoglycan-binding domain
MVIAMKRVLSCLLVAVVGACAAKASAAQPVLYPGATGGPVASWQRALNLWLSETGYPADRRLRSRLGGGLTVDGVNGPNTLAATKRFQQEGHRPATGTVELPDWLAWIGAEVTPNELTANSAPVGIRSGNFSAFTGVWQVSLNRWLRRHHQAEIVVDCSFGSQTATATRTFQRAMHRKTSGVVDRGTWAEAVRLGLTHLP